MQLFYVDFVLEFYALALRKSGSFTVIYLLLIPTHFNLFGKKSNEFTTSSQWIRLEN